MEKLPPCPECGEDYSYIDQANCVCPMCAYEWLIYSAEEKEIIKDANNNILNDGDTVTLIKDLKIKGTSSSIKIGTKVKNIKLVYEGDHNIDCKINGFGAIQLKSEFVKKI